MKPKAKVLLVDKEAEFLRAQKAALEDHGYQVFTATSGRYGLETVRSELPDLIVLDVMLEGHDTGFAFCARIRNDPLFKRIPILMVSSVAQATGYRFSQEEDGYWMKSDDYLDKPVEPELLLERMEKLLER